MAFKLFTEGRRKMRRYTKSHWTLSEDAILMNLVRRCGAGSWDYIARHIRGRTGKSCRLRWKNQLDPDVNRLPFSKDEQQKLFKLQKKYGNKWSTIAKHFPGRTDNQLKNHYHVMMGNYSKPSAASSGSYPRAPVSRGLIGNLYRWSIPCFTGMPMDVQARSSVSANMLSIHYCCPTSQKTPVMSDATSVALSGIIPLPQQGAGSEVPKFFDFMGVGTSE